MIFHSRVAFFSLHAFLATLPMSILDKYHMFPDICGLANDNPVP
jgi:hypothetical protein